LVPGLAYAQAPANELRVDSATQRLTYAEQVAMPGLPQAALYARAQAWLASAYQTTEQAAANSASEVQGTGWREIELVLSKEKSMPLNLWYRVILTVQPERYRYTISEFQLQPESALPDAVAPKQPIESVLRDEPVDTTPQTNYSQQAAAAARGIGDTIKAEMAIPSP
jgi:hypothetical protein